MKLLAVAALAFALASARADPATQAAIGLYAAGRYPEAAAALKKILATNPGNAAACFYLAETIEHGSDEPALRSATALLERAVALAPGNEQYLAEYGGTCLLLADRDRSFTAAMRGRDAMTQAIALDPNDLDARTGLMRFYAQAPWPLGDSDLALSQAEAIARRDPARGLRAFLRLAQIFEKHDDRPAARTACRAALRLNPSNPVATAALARLRGP
jgi:tetratricopeptide (TPR) repeat protein